MSLVKFHSPTQGSVIMFGEDAQTLLKALNLPDHGEMATAQLPEYLQRLEAAIDADKAANPVICPELILTEDENNEPVVVHVSQRATPMVQLMERCISATETITW
ncbi:MAG: DUF1840 family protein [Fluviibacter sp.]